MSLRSWLIVVSLHEKINIIVEFVAIVASLHEKINIIVAFVAIVASLREKIKYFRCVRCLSLPRCVKKLKWEIYLK